MPVKYIEFLGKRYHQQYLAKNPGGYCGLNGCYDKGNQKVLFRP
jgi:peptide methionine sulfoxide reductase MsrA